MRAPTELDPDPPSVGEVAAKSVGEDARDPCRTGGERSR
jgi:hypothetical protein